MKSFAHKRVVKHIISIVFIAIIAINFLLFFSIKKHQTDTIENKEKLHFPNYSELPLSEFMKSYEAYFNNHFPYKYAYIKSHNVLKKVYLKSSTSNDDVVLGKNDWLFYNASIYDSTGLNEFCGFAPWTNKELNKITTNINAISTFCENNGIEFQLIICPSKQSVYSDMLPNHYKKINKNRYDQLYEIFHQYINLKHEFLSYKLSHSHLLYYKTDTHWNLLAGVIAGQKLRPHFPYVPSLTNIKIKDSLTNNGFDLANMMALKQFYVDTLYRITFLEKPHQKIPHLIIVSDSFLEGLYPSLEQMFDSISTRHLYNDGIPSAKQLIKEKPDVFIIELTERYKELLVGNIDSEYFYAN